MRKSVGSMLTIALGMAMMSFGSNVGGRNYRSSVPDLHPLIKCKKYLETDLIPKGLTRTWVNLELKVDGIVYTKLIYVNHNKTSYTKQLNKEIKHVKEFAYRVYSNIELLENGFIVKPNTESNEQNT